MLIKYIRTPKRYEPKVEILTDGQPRAYLKEIGGNPIGVVISPEKGKVGWSLCNKKDTFNKEIGKKIALNRADFYGSNIEWIMKIVPKSIIDDVIEMYERSEKYYK